MKLVLRYVRNVVVVVIAIIAVVAATVMRTQRAIPIVRSSQMKK